MNEEECWVVETSRDGERWRPFGKAWKAPDEPVLLHAVPRFVRFHRLEEDDWSAPLERDGDYPMTLLHFEKSARQEMWPTKDHVGLPVVLPGGEEGRLLRFDHAEDPVRWTYALEFRGSRE